MKLADLITSPESRVYKVILFADIGDSTSMKLRDTEASWIGTYAWFYQTAIDVVGDHLGQIVKFLGDGVMAAFDSSHAADAINAAIKMQEATVSVADTKTVNVSCSIGISAGDVRQFSTPAGEDYVGSVVDRAARLCGDASPRAIFVDKETVAAAIMPMVQSRLGLAMSPRRTAGEYLGEVQRKPLRGFASTVEYHEIFWDKQLYGVKSRAVTETVEQPHTDGRESAAPAAPAEQRGALQIGQVNRWNSEKEHGFITQGNDFLYFDKRFMVKPHELAAHQRVAFVPRPPIVPGRHPAASCLMAIEEEAEGVLTFISPKHFGFIRVADAMGDVADVFVYLGDNPAGLKPGDRVRFVVGESARGPVATLPVACMA